MPRNNKTKRNRKPNRINNQQYMIHTLQLLQSFMRSYSCWNCHQIGHTRHQCRFPKVDSCSFCKRTGIKTIECGCQNRAPLNLNVNEAVHLIQENDYNENVLVPDQTAKSVGRFSRSTILDFNRPTDRVVDL